MISVIVPVYNTQRYLSQCVSSILRQTYGDIEVILVNDASTDDSLSICQAYAQKDKRIRVVDKVKNEGVDKARFSGLDVASGEYVMFVDSDDWLEGDAILSEMWQVAEDTGVDYVEMRMQKVLDRYGWLKKKNTGSLCGLIAMPELFDKYYISFFGYNILSVNMCGKFYRRDTIDRATLSPSGLSMGEDLYFNLMLSPYLRSIYIMDRVGYNYRFGGMTTRYNPYLLPDLKTLFKIKDELIAKYAYWKAYDFIRIELKNVLRSDICQIITFHKGDKAAVVKAIADELQDPVYDEIKQVRQYPAFFEEPFVKVIINKDATAIYEQCKEMVKGNRWRHQAKVIASAMLKYI